MSGIMNEGVKGFCESLLSAIGHCTPVFPFPMGN